MKHANEDVFTVKSVSANHSGTYLCTAKDSTGRSAEKMVVSYPPQVSVSEVVIHALSGDVAELICKVTGEPSPKVLWSKDGILLKKDKRIGIHNENTKHYLTKKKDKAGGPGDVHLLCQEQPGDGSQGYKTHC